MITGLALIATSTCFAYNIYEYYKKSNIEVVESVKCRNEIMDRRSWREFFKEIKVVNRHGETPIYVSEKLVGNQLEVKFRLPSGIMKDIIRKKRDQICQFVDVTSCIIDIQMNDMIIKLAMLNDEQRKYDIVFSSMNIKNSESDTPRYISHENFEHGIVVYYTFPMGLFDSLNDTTKAKIKAMFECNDVKMIQEKGKLKLFIYTSELPTMVRYNKALKCTDTRYLRIPIGESLDGVVEMDFSEENGHLSVVGESNSGKSTVGRVMLTHLARNYTRKDVRLWLSDLKGMELNSFADLEIVDRYNNLSTINTCHMILDIYQIMQKRSEVMNGVRSISNLVEYNELASKMNLPEYPRIIFYVEEVVKLFSEKPNTKFKYNGEDYTVGEVIDKYVELGQQGRSFGIHCWIFSQRTCKMSLDPRLKANIGTKLVLKCANGTNSEIALDKGDYSASELKGRGHGYLCDGKGKVELQCYYIDKSEVFDMIEDKLTVEGRKINKKERKALGLM